MNIITLRRRLHADSERVTWRERLHELHRVYSGAAQRAEVRMTSIGYDRDPSTASGRVEAYVIARKAKP